MLEHCVAYTGTAAREASPVQSVFVHTAAARKGIDYDTMRGCAAAVLLSAPMLIALAEHVLPSLPVSLLAAVECTCRTFRGPIGQPGPVGIAVLIRCRLMGSDVPKALFSAAALHTDGWSSLLFRAEAPQRYAFPLFQSVLPLN